MIFKSFSAALSVFCSNIIYSGIVLLFSAQFGYAQSSFSVSKSLNINALKGVSKDKYNAKFDLKYEYKYAIQFSKLLHQTQKLEKIEAPSISTDNSENPVNKLTRKFVEMVNSEGYFAGRLIEKLINVKGHRHKIGITPDDQQIDSLLALSKSQIRENSIELARMNQAAAEKLAIDRFGKKSRPWASCLVNKARLANFDDDLIKEREYLTESISLWEIIGTNHPDCAAAYNNMGNIYQDITHEYEKAIDYYNKSLEVYKTLPGQRKKGYYNSLSNLGLAFFSNTMYSKASECLIECISWYEMNSPTYLLDYFKDTDRLLNVYLKSDSIEKAEQLQVKVLEFSEKHLGTEHPMSLSRKRVLSDFYATFKDIDKSWELKQQVIDVKQRILGKFYKREWFEHHESLNVDLIDLADSLKTIAMIAWDQSEFEKALNTFSEFISIMMDHEISFDISAYKYYYLAVMLKKLESIEDSERLLKYTIEIIKKSSSVDERLLAECYDDLGFLYLGNENSSKAIPLFVESGKILKKVEGTSSKDYLLNLNKLGIAYADNKNYGAAEIRYKEAINLYEDSIRRIDTDYLGIKVNLANLYMKTGRFNDAEKLYLETYHQFLLIGDTTHLYYVNCLSNLVLLYSKMEPREDMIEWVVRNIKITRDVYGRESVKYSNSVEFITNLMRELKKYKEAEVYFLELVDVLGKIDKGSERHLGSMVNLGGNYLSLGNYEQSGKILFVAKNLFENYSKINHEYYANCISNIGMLYLEKGETDSGLKFLNEAVELYENHNHKGKNYLFSLQNLISFTPNTDINRKLGLNKMVVDWFIFNNDTLDIEYIESLNNLAYLLTELGNIEHAKRYYIQMISLYEILGRECEIESAGCMINLANLCNKTDQLSESEKLYNKAAQCLEGTGRTSHPYYANCIFNMASFYDNIESLDKAVDYYNRSIGLFRDAYGNNHENYRNQLMTIGAFMMKIGQDDDALDIMMMADSLYRASGDTLSYEYAGNLINIGIHFNGIGDIPKAKQYLLYAKNVLEISNFISREFYANCLSSLSDIYLEINQRELAKQTLEQTLHIIEQSSGKVSKTYLSNLNDLAKLEEDLGQYSNAEYRMKESVIIGSALLENAASFMSEEELSNYQKQIDLNVSRLCSFISKRININVEYDTYSKILYDQLLLSKGFLREVAQKINIEADKLPELSNLVKQYRSLKSILSARYTGFTAYGDSILLIEKKIEEIEKTLNRAVSKSNDYRKPITWKDIQTFLNVGEIAIEFVHFNLNFREGGDSIIYAAILIRSGDRSPIFIPICSEKHLLGEIVYNSPKGLEMNPAVYRGIEVPAYKGESAKLSSIIWKPLEPYLDSVKVIYYSPAGLLHRINFDAISLDKEARLGDNYKMLRLNNTRSLGESDSESSFESNDAILFGGIDYELDTAAVDSSLTINDAVFRSDVLRGLIWAGQDDAEKWNILSGTAIEINQIASILLSNNFQTVKYSEKDATEESFKKFGKQGNSPRILHIATHGFFFSNPLYVTSPKLDEMVADRRTVFKISDNPMIRSGLILYGANYAWKKNRTYKPGIEDGILTAYEISQTNLSNTELVVLSACETGLGDIQGNEGVYGLQRAFKIAGVKYLIMSLWQVPDKATSDFMTQFYMNWLEKKMTIPDAFRLTQKEMCQRFVDPYSWAGFVLIK